MTAQTWTSFLLLRNTFCQCWYGYTSPAHMFLLESSTAETVM